MPACQPNLAQGKNVQSRLQDARRPSARIPLIHAGDALIQRKMSAICNTEYSRHRQEHFHHDEYRKHGGHAI